MGRGIYEGSPRTERVQLEARSSDPSNPSNGEAWLRTDLTGTDKVGEYRWYDGASVNAVDIVTPGSTSSPVEEVLRVQTPSGMGVIKTAPRSDATYPEQSLQHAGSPLGLGYNAIPDSVIHRYLFEDDSDTSVLTDSIGSHNGAVSGMSFVDDGTAPEGSAYGGFDGVDDEVAGIGLPSSGDAFTITAYVNRDSTSRRDDYFLLNSDTEVYFRTNTDTLEVGVSGRSNYASSLSVPTGWVRIAFAYDGSSSMRFHVDGSNETDSSGDAFDVAGNDIGLSTDLGGSNRFQGGMDDVIVFDEMLSESQLNELP